MTATSDTHSSPSANLSMFDADQVRMMEEQCILVDHNDIPVGYDTKVKCHLHNGVDDCLLHRAFSVFLFNSAGELLLQKRASVKITFPDRWTNTCCSHPLYTIQNETIELNAQGVKNAAIRKLEHELGIVGEIEPSDIHWLTKIHYGAHSDSQWGEHEIDWILFIQKDVKCNINTNEVSEIRYVDANELQELINEHNQSHTTLTPWFELIAVQLLFPWWKQLNTIIKNQGIGEDQHKVIHRLGSKSTAQHQSQTQHLTH